MIAPCHGCTSRTAIPNCHVTCDRYREYSTWQEMIREKRQLSKKGLDARYAQAERKAMIKFKSRRK